MAPRRGDRTAAIGRIKDAYALLTKIERVRLLELERDVADLAELERVLAARVASGEVDSRLAQAFLVRMKSVRRDSIVKGQEVVQQAALTLEHAAREKTAEKLHEELARSDALEAERKELARTIEAALVKASLP